MHTVNPHARELVCECGCKALIPGMIAMVVPGIVIGEKDDRIEIAQLPICAKCHTPMDKIIARQKSNTPDIPVNESLEELTPDEGNNDIENLIISPSRRKE